MGGAGGGRVGGATSRAPSANGSRRRRHGESTRVTCRCGASRRRDGSRRTYDRRRPSCPLSGSRSPRINGGASGPAGKGPGSQKPHLL
ncbi:Hypothetical protein NTJ_03932 [Nesidiocoris tenuis]|uniref:Uncharacterized protein n=1 Tax=Nesidiocoris tenuis TaxID=355587 RepID=A0ABN7AIU5_9HEMI|nr:Hypothetical protein NTJ_03932 [Nesidiocoris tenuis]